MDSEQQQPNVALELGTALSEARQQAGLSITAVADQLHLKQSFVEALESGDYQVIGSMVYVKGYMRTYTRLLQIDLEPKIALLQTDAPPSNNKAKQGYIDRSSQRGRLWQVSSKRFKKTLRQKKYLWLWLLAAALLVLYVFNRHALHTTPSQPLVPTANTTATTVSLTLPTPNPNATSTVAVTNEK